jgi:hypothetical protein
MRVKVRNFNSRNGNAVPNQFIIDTENGTYFQSYSTIICYVNKDGVHLDTNAHSYSRTTSKYLNEFLGNNVSERRKLIKDGKIKVLDLNKDR